MEKEFSMQIKYLGHSAFEIQTTHGNILIDPFISINPNYIPQNIVDIFVTHGHSDHLGSAIEISREQRSTITAVFELANYCQSKGGIANGISLGGKIQYPWGWAVFMPAFHSSSTPDGNYAGCPASIVLNIEGVTLFHAGDTCLHSEMKIIKELYTPDIAFLPIGGHFTMDIEQATIAAKWLGSTTVIPMHYNTFPLINASPEILKNILAEDNINVEILNINQSLKL